MEISRHWLRKHIAAGLAVLLAVPLAEVAAAQPRFAACFQQAQSTPSTQDQSQASSSQLQNAQSSPSQNTSAQKQDSVTKPVGTAAAPDEKVSGVAASRPAGFVIAPAKQRRARAILIRVAVVVGAAVAVGTVVAFSRASPSRPN